MNTHQRSLELADYVSVVWKRKRLLLICTLVAMIVAAVVSLFQPNVYRATASLVVLPPKFQTELAPSALSVHTYMNLLIAPELLQAIVDTLGAQDLVADVLRKRLETEIIQEKYGNQRIAYSPLIMLHARADSPRKAKDIANAWAELFVSKVRGLSFQGKEGSLEFISSQFEETAKSLESSENTLKAFQSQWRIDLLERELAVKENNLIESESDVYKVQSEIETVRNELTQLKEEIQSQDVCIVLSKAITDQALWDTVMRDSSVSFLQGLDDIKLRSETLNPIYENLQQRIVNNNVKLHELTAREKYLFENIKKREKEIGQLRNTIIEKKLEQERLKRQVQNYKRTYDLLAEKAESARLAKAEESEDIKIAARAVEPRRKIGPNRKRNVLTAGVVVFIAAMFFAFFLEYVTAERTSVGSSRNDGGPKQ